MFSKTFIEEKNQTAVWGSLTKKSRQCCWISPLTDWRLQRRLDFLSCAMMLPSINHRKFNRKISWKCTLGGGIERGRFLQIPPFLFLYQLLKDFCNHMLFFGHLICQHWMHSINPCLVQSLSRRLWTTRQEKFCYWKLW